MIGSLYLEFFHIHVFVGIHETIKNNQEDLKHYICFKVHKVFSELCGRNFNRCSTILLGIEVGLKLFFICSLEVVVGLL